MLDERLGKWFFWIFVIGFNLTFFIQHFLGIFGMSRRVYTYPNLPGYWAMNLTSTVGAFLMGFAVLFLVYILLKAQKGEKAPDDPWNAYTLEWTTSSPPPSKNFDRVIAVNSYRPFRDLKVKTGQIKETKDE
jgi:cytochrome c oxidase subunit 1/cytochrome c oxidase subunit I+III